MEKLIGFVAAHRECFKTEHGNIFATSLSKVIRHWRFLEIIHRRHTEASAAFAANTQTLIRSVPPKGRGVFTPEQAELYAAGDRLSTAVHLEVESFYLFGKILLDESAHAIEYYFGSQRNLPLDSHDDLSKNLTRYAEAKGLQIPGGFEDIIAGLRKRIADFRDSQIAHEKSPRTVRGTIADPTDARMVTTRLYPKDNDQQVESESLAELINAIGSYVGDHLIGFIESNSAKTRLK